MKLYDIEWHHISETRQEIHCPVCNAVWLQENPQEESPREPVPCMHLRFMGLQEGEPIFFGKWDKKKFFKAYWKAEKDVYGEDADSDSDSDDEMEYMDFNILEKMETNQIDEIAMLTDDGMACGPVSFTVYFGIKR